jgi:hypothetical protein
LHKSPDIQPAKFSKQKVYQKFSTKQKQKMQPSTIFSILALSATAFAAAPKE